ncbi:MAG: hypothetical protein ACYDDB_07525, partial [bacterium]
IHIKYNGVSLKYKEIIKRPVKVAEKVIKIRKEYTPPLDHPWRYAIKEYFRSRADEKYINGMRLYLHKLFSHLRRHKSQVFGFYKPPVKMRKEYCFGFSSALDKVY